MTEASVRVLASFLNTAAWDRLAERLDLSPREVQILQGVFLDQKELAIARQLHMSPHTVHTHMERLHRKLSVTSRPELIIEILTAFLMITIEPNSPLPAICPYRGTGQCPLHR